ncbi:MAG: site-specific DNA-methyltransferase [Tenericutes bacterium]|nr:site-specific DNA-methyltransferase [Mycoplasmatota bacterium]
METNIIYNEDCYVGIKTIPDNSIDLVIIDPPYDINTRKNRIGYNRIAKSILKVENTLVNHNLTDSYDFSLLDELIRIMKKVNIYIWCNKNQIEDYLKYFVDKHKCRYEVLIWNKTNAMPLYSNKYINDKEYCLYFRKESKCNPATYEDARTVYTSPSNARDRVLYQHPTIKPVDFIRKMIRNSSNENDVVLDCFMGSGTTAVASIIENRKYIGFEINKRYYDISNARIEKILEEKELWK